MMILLTAPMFGTKHLLGLLFVVILVIVLFILSKRREVDNKKMMLYLSISFLVLEIIKLTMMTINKGEFPMNHLPLHLCSLPLYLYPILYFSKENSIVERYVKPAAFAGVLFAAIAALAIPTNIIGNNEQWIPFDDNFYPLLSFIYHGLMMFAALYIIKSGYLKLKYSDIPKAWITSSCLMVLAIIANITLNRDFMLLNTGNGSPLVFLLDHGQLVYTFSMIGLGFLVMALIITVTILIQELFKSKDM